MARQSVRAKGPGLIAARAGSTNLLLAALSSAEYGRLKPHLTRVPLTHRLFLQNRDQTITDVYFPEAGVCSLTTSMENGDSVEVATVGREGLVGLDLVIGSEVSTVDAFVQVPPGNALRLPASIFRREMAAGGSLAAAVGRYAPALMAQIVQTAACNRLHKVQARCARWLLLTHDRIESDEFSLSHEFLAIMLGVERTTVTAVAGALQRARLIRYVHGQVTVVNRAGLERASCECYRIVAVHFERIGLPPFRPHRRTQKARQLSAT